MEREQTSGIGHHISNLIGRGEVKFDIDKLRISVGITNELTGYFKEHVEITPQLKETHQKLVRQMNECTDTIELDKLLQTYYDFLKNECQQNPEDLQPLMFELKKSVDAAARQMQLVHELQKLKQDGKIEEPEKPFKPQSALVKLYQKTFSDEYQPAVVEIIIEILNDYTEQKINKLHNPELAPSLLEKHSRLIKEMRSAKSLKSFDGVLVECRSFADELSRLSDDTESPDPWLDMKVIFDEMAARHKKAKEDKEVETSPF